MGRLISERVTVERGDGGALTGFTWRRRTHRIAEVLSDVREPDYGPPWRLRRHRRRVVTRTEDGRWFELYVERPGQWVLYQELDDPFA